MAHELAHQRLLGERRSPADRYDNELLTDLTAVFHGFGVFLANNPRKSTGKLSRWPGTQLFMPEYLSEPMFGYAMAHIAWVRDERSPAWARHFHGCRERSSSKVYVIFMRRAIRGLSRCGCG